MFVDFNILNQLGSPSINSNTFANRPAAGQTGRLFVSTDTFEIFRDNGTGWDLIGGPGAGTITGTGTATQVAYFTGAQTIGSSANLFWDNTAGALGINTATPSAELDIHGTGIIVQVNSTSATANSLLAFQRSGSGVWRIGDQYNGGSNFFELHNTVLTNNAIEVTAANNKSTFLAVETYASGLAIGNRFTYDLTVPNGVNITSPNAVGAVNSYLNLSLGGNTTVPSGARQGLEGNSRISFTGAGTLTMTQGSTVRAFSALSSVYSFVGSAVGTVTHLAGLRICFPDNLGSAINITNNYGILINDQTTGLGTVNYTNRWGIYQEGISDLNYFAGNTLIGTTVNSGDKLNVLGNGNFASTLGSVRILPSDTINGITLSTTNAGNTSTLIIRNRPVGTAFNSIGSSGTNNQYLQISGGSGFNGQGLQLLSSAGANGNTRLIIDTLEVARVSPANFSVTTSGIISADASAVLQADSTSAGFLKPRMNTTSRNAIVSPANGLEIYNTDTNSTDYWNGATWLALGINNLLTTTAFQALGSQFKGFSPFNPGYNCSATNSPTSQTIYFTAYYLPIAQTITGVKFFQSTQGNYTASNYNGVGLYTYNAGTLTQVASSTNDGNIWKGGAQTWQTKAFSSTYNAQPGIYFIAVLYSSSAVTSSPALGSTNSASANAAVYDFTNSAKLSASINAQTSLPASQVMSSLTTSTFFFATFLY